MIDKNGEALRRKEAFIEYATAIAPFKADEASFNKGWDAYRADVEPVLRQLNELGWAASDVLYDVQPIRLAAGDSRLQINGAPSKVPCAVIALALLDRYADICKRIIALANCKALKEGGE